jgi:hypothetical protein
MEGHVRRLIASRTYIGLEHPEEMVAPGADAASY